MTNSEKLRQVSDAELASCIMCPKDVGINWNDNCSFDDNSDCYSCCLKFLKAEVAVKDVESLSIIERQLDGSLVIHNCEIGDE